MTDGWTPAFHSGERGRRSPGQTGPKGQKGQKGGHKVRGSRKRSTEPSREQPIPESAGAVPCPICGHPVDPKRQHIHMVRFHGAALRPGKP
jgi:hypothetical protein